jgi:hypothetical protein
VLTYCEPTAQPTQSIEVLITRAQHRFVHWDLSPIAELYGQIRPVRILEPPVANINIDALIAFCLCIAAHDLVVSSGEMDCMAGDPKAVLELRFCALVAGAIKFERDRSD